MFYVILMLFNKIINVKQSYEIVQFCNLINYKFTKFTMFTSLHVCKIVNRAQLTIKMLQNLQLYNVRSTWCKLQLQCQCQFKKKFRFTMYFKSMETMSMYQLIRHGIYKFHSSDQWVIGMHVSIIRS